MPNRSSTQTIRDHVLASESTYAGYSLVVFHREGAGFRFQVWESDRLVYDSCEEYSESLDDAENCAHKVAIADRAGDLANWRK